MPTKSSAVQLEHQRLATLINSMTDGVLAVDEQCHVVLYNAAALNILDTNTSIKDQPLKEVLKLHRASGQLVKVDSLIRKDKMPFNSRDFLFHYTDGSTANIYLSISPVRLGYGQAGQSGYVLLMRDITHEKSLEEERDEFISVISHELRTPIAIAEGDISNAQLLANKRGSHIDITQALEEAHQQVIFLSNLINDLSTLARAERGKLEVNSTGINVTNLIESLAKNYEMEAESKHLKLITDISPHLELLYTTELYVREILQNFITNALKYTPEGSITLRAQPKDEGVEFQVSDTGIGISRNDQDKVFNKFFRSEDYRTRQTSGTGLGLYITAKLASLIKAKLSVESQLNEGSTFSIYVPSLKPGHASAHH